MGDDIASIVQIDDPDIDRAAIYARIHEGLARRGPPPAVDFPRFEPLTAPTLRSRFFSAELARQLEAANASFDQVWVELSVTERHVPIVGVFINRFKRALHRLVVYYVNRLGRRQQAVNADLVRLINQTAAEIDAADLTALRRDVDDARARLAALEAKLERSGKA